MDYDDFENEDENKPRGSIGYWLGMIAVAVVFGLGIAFFPTVLSLG